MADFRRKSLPAYVTEAVRCHASVLPSAIVQQAPLASQPISPTGQGRARDPKTIQLDMNVSEDMARLVARLPKEAGTACRVFARLLNDAGSTSWMVI